MKNKQKISVSNLPTRIPIFQAIVIYLLLDNLNAPDWIYGALGFMWLMLIIVAIIAKIKEEEIDIFDTSPNGKSTKETFREKLKDAMDKASEQKNKSK